MNTAKKWLSILLCIIMAGTVFAVVIGAAGGATNAKLEVEQTEVTVGDTVTVTFGNSAMKVKSFTGGFTFDNTLLECESIVGIDPNYPNDYSLILKDGGRDPYVTPTAVSSIEQANANGTVGYAYAGAYDWEYVENTLFIITFRAKAAGTVSLTLYEDTTGTDAFKSDSVETKTVTIAAPACTHEETTTSYSKINGQDKHTVTVTCNACEELVDEYTEDCDGGTANCKQAATCEKCGESYGSVNATVHVGSDFATTYDKIVGQDKHTVTVTCNACGEQVGEATEEACDGGAANCQEAATCVKCGESYGSVNATVHTGSVSVLVDNGDGTHTSKWSCCDAVHETVAHAEGYECVCGYTFTGWDGKLYIKNGEKLEGWSQVGDFWYYFGNDGYVTGLSRVPYPTAAIDDVTYKPNQEDIDFAVREDITFLDAETAWFVFGTDGKFDSATKIIDGMYSAQGMIAWHPGFVTVEGTLYYFVGDVEKGGNKLAEGEIYVTRINGIEGYKSGDIVTFANGQVVGLNGIVDGYYYENGKRMIGVGLVKIGDDYIYVRSSGKLATGTYYVTKVNDLEGFTTGMKLCFGEDGKMQTIKNGLVEDGGKTYYYVNNRIQYGAGLIEYDGAVYYVRSNGQVATGMYYITITNGMTGFVSGQAYNFGTDGKLVPPVNGIVEENGALYFYENGRIQYGAGLIEYEGSVYYVRSNGQVATGVYYITTTNDMEGFTSGQAYTFDTDGKLVK